MPMWRMAIDIDGVLADMISSFLPLMNRRFGRNLTARDITRYAFEEVAQVPAEEMNAFIRELGQQGLYRQLGLVAGAREALGALEHSAHLHLITSRPPEVAEDTRAWLAACAIPYHQLTFRRRPAKLLAEDRADVVVEDDRDAAAIAAKLAPRVFLLDYPYNRQGVALPEHCLRVSGWDEILAHLRTE
jgi:uncharacterized HAD superfamily protein